jgi:hypothetical protein
MVLAAIVENVSALRAMPETNVMYVILIWGANRVRTHVPGTRHVLLTDAA